MAADKRAKISFLSPPTGQDSYGGPTGSWTAVYTGIWASKEPILGNEYFSAQAVQSQVACKFRCQYLSSVTNTMKIQHGTEYYQILDAINVKNYNRELLCYCKKVDA